jgi:NADPH:quinone reductase
MLVQPEAYGEDRLKLADIARPEPGPGEVLVQVAASGVNRADALQRRGRYRQSALERPTGPQVAGMEVAGTVSDVGPGVTTWSRGDQVMAMCGGSYADLAVVDAALAMRVPGALSPHEAACLPVALMTAYDALALAGEVRPGQRVLITGAASVVGLMACQVARALGAFPVLGLSRSEHGRSAIAATGARPLDARSPLASELNAAIGQATIDVVIDHVGGQAAAQAIACLGLGGRLVSVGRLGGRALQLDLNELARKRLRLIGTTFRTRDLDAYRAIADGAAGTLLPLIASGQVIPPAINRVFPLDQANEAIDHALTQHLPGKVVVDVGLRSTAPGVLLGQLLPQKRQGKSRSSAAGRLPRRSRGSVDACDYEA